MVLIRLKNIIRSIIQLLPYLPAIKQTACKNGIVEKNSTRWLYFFTNIESNKGRQFMSNKNLSMCFYWESLNKQIRISGRGSIIDSVSSDKYFSSRPVGSQIGAWASNQSNEIKSRKSLMNKYTSFEKKYKKNNVPRPKYWVGIKISPSEFEFWQQGKFRMHKREVYYLTESKMAKENLIS